MNKKKEVIIGLDVGIASLGWCITNKEDHSIVLHGVRLFNTVDHPKDGKLLNETRRLRRQERRRSNRKKVLKRDFIKFLIENNYIQGFKIKDKKDNSFVEKFRKDFLIPLDKKMNSLYKNDPENPYWIYQLRQKALTEKIDFEILIAILYWYLKKRGFTYTQIEETDEKENKKSYRTLTSLQLKNEYPVNLQINEYIKSGTLKSNFNRQFKRAHFIEEIKKIFKTQKIDNKLETKFLELFKRERSFEEGPGSLKNPTPYGVYQEVNGVVKRIYDTIWDKTTGKCSLYKEEYRAPKNSFSAEIFNLLNDLNNIKINGKNKLSKEDKEEIIKLSLLSKANLNKTLKYLTTKYDVIKGEISGLRIDKNKKVILTELESYHCFKKLFDKNFLFNDVFKNDKFWKENPIDILISIYNKTTIAEKRIKTIKNNIELKKYLNKELTLKDVKFSATKTHSLSFKALKEYINKLLIESKNYSELSYQDRQKYEEDLSSLKFIPKKWISEIICSPSVKRSLNQTISIINNIISYCDTNNLIIKDIVIEMTRETNNKKEREKISNVQKFLEERNQKISERLSELNFKNNNGKKGSGLYNKLLLWETQNHHDAYDGSHIDFNDLVKNANNFDIDHIIPYSQSFDNSFANKVLTSNKNNSLKTNKTPYYYMNQKKFEKMKEKWLQWFINDGKENKNYNPKKYKNLIDQTDYSKPENQLGFINRNFVDTSYVASEMLKILKNFFENKNEKIIVKTINGKMTSFARKIIENNKNKIKLQRPEGCGDQFEKKNNIKLKNRIWHGHHAEDAYLISLLSLTYKTNKLIEKYAYKNESVAKNLDLKLNWVNNLKDLENNLLKGLEELNKKINDLKFTRKKEIKTQLKGCNEQLIGSYKINDKEIQSFKYLKLNDLSSGDCEKYFSENGKLKNKVIINSIKGNFNLYKVLCDIYQSNKSEKFPFKKYQEDNDDKMQISYKSKKGKNINLTINKIKINHNSPKKIINQFFGKNQNGYSFYEKLNWIRIDIYKDQKGKYKIIPINIKNALFNGEKIEIKKDEMNKIKNIKNVSLDAKKEFSLHKYDIIEKNNGKEYFVTGCKEKSGAIELKPLNKIKKEQKYYSINTNLKNSFLVFKDWLGFVKNKQKIFI